MTVRRIIGPTILTADGFYFDYEAPDSDTITMNAIARGLANTCRFAGQCRRFYSVAEHSIWVSNIVPPELAFVGLMHDAAEAFIGDMPKPLKEMLPDYQEVERRIELAVLGAFNIGPLPPEIKKADRIMLATEQRALMDNRDNWKWTDGVQPLDVRLECMSPDEAYLAFYTRGMELWTRTHRRSRPPSTHQRRLR